MSYDIEQTYTTWRCVKCKREFIDPDDNPYTSDAVLTTDLGWESRLFWLGITEPVCSECAAISGIPPIDEGDV